MKKVLLALCVFWLAAVGARADGGSPVYNVAGTLTIAGTNATEVITFSFQADYAYMDYGAGNQGTGYYLQILPGATVSGSDAAIGAVTYASNSVGSPRYFAGGDKESNLIGFTDGQGDGFDLYLQNNVFPSDPPPPAIAGGYIYYCVSAECDNNFCPPVGFGCVPGVRSYVEDFGKVTQSVTVVETPEPSESGLMFLGLSFLMVLPGCRFVRGKFRECGLKRL
jgi:hypothetical protein